MQFLIGGGISKCTAERVRRNARTRTPANPRANPAEFAESKGLFQAWHKNDVLRRTSLVVEKRWRAKAPN